VRTQIQPIPASKEVTLAHANPTVSQVEIIPRIIGGCVSLLPRSALVPRNYGPNPPSLVAALDLAGIMAAVTLEGALGLAHARRWRTPSRQR